MSYKRKIKWYERTMPLQQVFHRGLMFAFVSDQYEQCCPFVLCKDFLQDTIHAYLTKKKRSIFGFSYDPKRDPHISIKKTRLVIGSNGSANLRNNIPNCIEFLNQIEDHLHLSKTKYRECCNPPKRFLAGGVWYLEGSRRWIKSPPMISFYTLLIRVGMCHVKGTSYTDTIEGVKSMTLHPEQCDDRSRLIGADKGIQKILSLGDRKVFTDKFEENYPKNVQTKIMHDDCGIIGYSCNATHNYFPHWSKV